MSANFLKTLDRIQQLATLTVDSLSTMKKTELDVLAKELEIKSPGKIKKADLILKINEIVVDLASQIKPQVEVQSEDTKIEKQDVVEGVDVSNTNTNLERYPVIEIADWVYTSIKKIVIKEKDVSVMKSKVLSVVTNYSVKEMMTYTISTVKSRRSEVLIHLEKTLMNDNSQDSQTIRELLHFFEYQLLEAMKEEMVVLNRTYKKEVKERNISKEDVRLLPVIQDVFKTYQNLKTKWTCEWEDLSIFLTLTTGRKMAEIHALGSISIDDCETFEVFFLSQGKTRKNESKPYKIPVLFENVVILKAFTQLGEQGRRLSPVEQQNDRKAVNNAFASTLNRKMKKYGISYKVLRGLYAELMWNLYPENLKVKTEKHIKFSEWLGLGGENGLDTTFASYTIYNIVDINEVKKLLNL